MLLIPDAREIFPFLLQDRLIQSGARFSEGAMYLNNISQDQHLLTGQNPWSVWALAEAMVSQLGYQPVPRLKTAEENTVLLLHIYESHGYDAAKEKLQEYRRTSNTSVTRNLMVMHSLVAAMQWRLGKTIDLISLARLEKSLG